MNRNQDINLLGAYALATLDSAMGRKMMTPESAQTLLNGLVEIYLQGKEPAFESPQLLSPLAGADLSDPAKVAEIVAKLQESHQGAMVGATKELSRQWAGPNDTLMHSEILERNK